jgi:hypothetical protein
VGCGEAWGTTRCPDGAAAAAGAAEALPVGSFSTVPMITWASGASPFMNATWLAVTPLRAAIPERVSPGCTV